MFCTIGAIVLLESGLLGPLILHIKDEDTNISRLSHAQKQLSTTMSSALFCFFMKLAAGMMEYEEFYAVRHMGMGCWEVIAAHWRCHLNSSASSGCAESVVA